MPVAEAPEQAAEREKVFRARTQTVVPVGTILERYIVDSSWVSEVLWVQVAEGREGLVLAFHTGGPFYYPGGTRDHLHRLINASSVGKTFHSMTDIYSLYGAITLSGVAPTGYKAPQALKPGESIATKSKPLPPKETAASGTSAPSTAVSASTDAKKLSSLERKVEAAVMKAKAFAVAQSKTIKQAKFKPLKRRSKFGLR